MAKKKVVGGTASERPIFEPDAAQYTTEEDKNNRLADLLQTLWNDRAIVLIKRIEIGIPGWEAVCRGS